MVIVRRKTALSIIRRYLSMDIKPTGLGYNFCGNNYGIKLFFFWRGKIFITVYVCEVCCRGQTDYEVFLKLK